MDRWVVDIGTDCVFGMFDTQGEAIQWAALKYPSGGWRVIRFLKAS